jgi:diguanylate cyclase (GGDEF)-like protein/PAS domain S-box-containing protein
VGFLSVCCLLGFLLYLRRVLRYLDPSSVIPRHVQAALNTLAEGVLVLDKHQQIVLANEAFVHTVGRTFEQLQGRSATEIDWTTAGSKQRPDDYPWMRAIRDGRVQKRDMLALQTAADGTRTLAVNAAPILDDRGNARGALATFDDVTAIEEKNTQLAVMLETVTTSRQEIEQKNRELYHLATRDPLTQCLNRRSFFTEMETRWAESRAADHHLACVMSDVDHFKNVNDTRGHLAGDEVLKGVAAALQGAIREGDLLCRYGGEEFCVLLPGATLAVAAQVAERFREAVQSRRPAGLEVTASFGVASTEFKARQPQELLDQADRSLYAAKRSGRNRVTCWDQIASLPAVEPTVDKAEKSPQGMTSDPPIVFHEVAALLCALANRDVALAEHSCRVAELCVSTAQVFMSHEGCFLIEVGALLHDLGKLGLPEQILKKPTPLTAEEWQQLRAHDRTGVEIVAAAFGSKALTEIVRTHHSWYQGNPRDRSLPRGDEIPLAARIVAIADAFDTMVSARYYGAKRTREEALAEIRRCTPQQFDPRLVDRFAEVVHASDRARQPDSPRTIFPFFAGIMPGGILNPSAMGS